MPALRYTAEKCPVQFSSEKLHAPLNYGTAAGDGFLGQDLPVVRFSGTGGLLDDHHHCSRIYVRFLFLEILRACECGTRPYLIYNFNALKGDPFLLSNELTKFSAFFSLLLVTVFFYYSGCKENSVDAKGQILSLSTDSIYFSSPQDSIVIYLKGSIPKSSKWKSVRNNEWLIVSPSEGSCDDQAVPLILKIDSNYYDSGPMLSFLTIRYDDVNLCSARVILQNPFTKNEFTVNDTLINFTPARPARSVIISNVSNSSISWSAKTLNPWFFFVRASGSLQSKQSDELNIQVNFIKFPAYGKYSDTLLISALHQVVKIPISIEWNQYPKLRLSKSPDTLGVFNKGTNFIITNVGNVEIPWKINQSYSFIETVPQSGVLKIYDSVKVNVSIKRDSVITGLYSPRLLVDDGFGGLDSFRFNFYQYKEAKWIMGTHAIIDAKYDRVNDYIIALVREPIGQGVEVYDPIRRRVVIGASPSSSVNNSVKGRWLQNANCYSFGSMGDKSFIVVGHDGLLRIIYFSKDYNSYLYESVIPVPIDVFDVAVSDSGWVFAFPGSSRNTHVQSVDLASNIVMEDTTNTYLQDGTVRHYASVVNSYQGIYASTTQPDGNYIERYTMKGGKATWAYRSTIDNDNYVFGGPFWISEKQLKAFTITGRVFSLSRYPLLDLIYYGRMNGIERIKSLDVSIPQQRIALIQNRSKEKIELFNTELASVGSILVPSFVESVNDSYLKYHPASAQFVFTRSTGDSIYVMQNYLSDPESWGISVFDLAHPPLSKKHQ